MLRRSFRVTICALVAAIATTLSAQPPQPGQPNETTKEPPLGVEKMYWELTKSDNASTRTLAERYVNLVKVQEWSDLTGKFKAVAHYVKHDSNLSTVTIAIMKGTGADRTSDEKTVPVDKLSKTCQARVKQIDLVQKKLREVAAKSPTGAPGMPMADEHGADPNAKGPDAGAGAPPAAAPDPSALEPDPLGFAEVQLAPLTGAGGGPAAPGGAGPGTPDVGPGNLPPAPPSGRPPG